MTLDELSEQGPPPLTSTREIGEAFMYVAREQPGTSWTPVTDHAFWASQGWEVQPLIPASDLEQVIRERDGLREALRRLGDQTWLGNPGDHGGELIARIVFAQQALASLAPSNE